jgi:hypothetical protein
MSRRFGRVPNGPATGKEPPRRGLSEAAEQLQPTGPGVRPSEAYPKWCVTCERYVPNEHFHDSERPAVGQSPACQHERVLTSVYCNDCETTVSIKAADGPTAGHIVAWAMQADNGTYYNLTWAEYAESADRMAARGFRALIDMERPADSNTTPEEG